MSTSVSAPELKRAIGPRLLLLFVVGDILGTGVYALTGAVAGEAGGRRRPADREHFHAPRVLPYVGALTCAFLVGPWAQDPIEYQIAGGLIAIGLVLWVLTWVFFRRGRAPLEPGEADAPTS